MRRSLRLLLAAAGIVSIGAMSVMALVTPATDVPVASAAAVDYFLKIDGIEGESSDAGHRNEIEIQSFSWGVSSPRDVATGQSSGKRQHKPFTITKELDKSSPLLAKAVATGQHIPRAVLTGRAPDGHEFEVMSFFDVFVGDFMQSGDNGSKPMESISLNFTKIEFKYVPQGADGKPGTPVTTGWDLATAKK